MAIFILKRVLFSGELAKARNNLKSIRNLSNLISHFVLFMVTSDECDSFHHWGYDEITKFTYNLSGSFNDKILKSKFKYPDILDSYKLSKSDVDKECIGKFNKEMNAKTKFVNPKRCIKFLDNGLESALSTYLYELEKMRVNSSIIEMTRDNKNKILDILYKIKKGIQ